MKTGYGFKKTLSVCAVASLAWLPFAVRADVSAAWNQNSDGNWSAGGNWAGGNAATGTTGVATFTYAITASRTVTVDSSPWAINGMTFANTGSYGWTVAGGMLNLAGTLPTITVNPGSTAKLASMLTGSAGLTKAGTGTLVLTGANTYSGTTTNTAGTLQIGDGTSATASAGSGLLAAGSSGTLALNLNGAATLVNSSVISSGCMIQNIGVGKVTLTNGVIAACTVDGGAAGIVLANPITSDFTPRGDITFGSTSSGRTVVSGAAGTTMHIVSSGLFWWTGANSSANAPTFDVAAGVTVSLNSGQQAGTIYYNNLTGAGNFTFDGGNASQLGIVLGTNTIGGTLTANRPVSFGNGGTGGLAGSGTLVASANGSFIFNSTTDNTYSGNMSGAGALVKTNANTLTLTGTNTYSGATTIYGGTLAIGGAGTLGTGAAYAGTILNNGTLLCGSSAAQTLSGGISGAGSLTKSGTGTLTLSGYNTYTGATRVNAGKLVGTTGSSCLNSRVTVADSATNGVRILAYGDQWACSSLAYAGNAACLDIDFAALPVSATLAPLQINGDLSVTGIVAVVVRNGSWPATGAYPLVSYTGSLSGPGSFSLASLPPGLSATLVNNTGAKRLDLSVTDVPAASGSLSTWVNLVGGNAGGDWGTSANWSGGIPDATDAVADFSTLDISVASCVTNASPHTVGTLRFGDTAPSHDWTVTNSTLALATSLGLPTVTVNNRTATILTGLTGNQGFVKNGNGTLALSGGTGNTFSGQVPVCAGTLSVNNGASLKNTASPITVLSGACLNIYANWDGNPVTNALFLSGSGIGNWGALHVGQNVTISGPITLVTDARITHRDNCSINGPVTTTGAGKNLELYLSEYMYATFVNGSINLGTGSLKVNSIAGGNGPNIFTLQLNAANTYAGGTVLTNYAMLQIGNAGALGSGGVTFYPPSTRLDLNAFSVTLPWLSGSGGAITATGAAGTSLLTVNQSADTAFSGVISNGALRSVALLKTGTGTLALSGTNTYTGATTVSNGILCVNGSLGNTVVTVCTGCCFAAGATGVVGRASIAGTLTFQSGSRLLVDVLPPSADAVSVAGDVTVGSNVELRVSGDQTRRGGSWKVVESTGGTLSGDFVFVGGVKGVTLTKVGNAVWLTIPPKGTLIGVR